MKKTAVFIAGTALAGALALSMPILANAEDGAQAQVQTGVRVRLENNRDVRNDAMKRREAPVNAAVRAQANVDDRRPMMGGDVRVTVPAMFNRLSTSTRALVMEHMASTTAFRGHEMWKEARVDAFVALQTKLVAEAQRSLANLKDLRARIAARITTAETSGRNMTDAKAALATADQKITAAETAIQALATYTPPSVSTTGSLSASTTVSLDKPRAIGKAAIQAVNDARKALNQTIVAIAHSMGFKLGADGHVEAGEDATTTATTTSTQ
jgi:hypothetical protein